MIQVLVVGMPELHARLEDAAEKAPDLAVLVTAREDLDSAPPSDSLAAALLPLPASRSEHIGLLATARQALESAALVLVGPRDQALAALSTACAAGAEDVLPDDLDGAELLARILGATSRDAWTRGLRAGARNLRHLFERTRTGILVVDEEGGVLDVNRSAEEFFGRTQDELIGAPLGLPVVSGERCEIQSLGKGGQPRSAEIQSVPVVWFGRPGYLVTLHDITERQQMVERLLESEQQFRHLFEVAEEMACFLELDDRVSLANPAFLRTLGYSEGDREDLRLPHLVRDDDLEDLHRARHLAVTSGSAPPFRATLKTRTGREIPVEAHLAARFEEGKAVALRAVFRDMRRQVEVERLKDEFVSTVSHELRTPLTSIHGALSLLESQPQDAIPPQAARMIGIAARNSARLVRLINDVLDVQRLEATPLSVVRSTVDMREVLAETLAGLEPFAAEAQVRLVSEVPTSPVLVQGERDRLVQVATNLVSNAIKFSPADSPVSCVLTAEDTRARLAVQDRGPGIAPEFHAKVFEPFAQQDSSHARLKGGSGLGLHISRRLTEEHGGSLHFITRLDEGTTFFLDLPRRRGAEAARPSPSRVLVLEDNPDTAHLIQLVLSEVGIESEVAPDLTTARAMLALGGWRAATLDLMLAGDERGVDLVPELVAAQVPAVILSNLSREDALEMPDLAAALDQPRIQYLQKPVLPESLNAALTRAFRDGRSQLTVLHVDPDSDLRVVVEGLLGRSFKVLGAATLAGARTLLGEEAVDLVICEATLPDGAAWAFLDEDPDGPPAVLFCQYPPPPVSTSRLHKVLVKGETNPGALVEAVETLAWSRRPDPR